MAPKKNHSARSAPSTDQVTPLDFGVTFDQFAEELNQLLLKKLICFAFHMDGIRLLVSDMISLEEFKGNIVSDGIPMIKVWDFLERSLPHLRDFLNDSGARMYYQLDDFHDSPVDPKYPANPLNLAIRCKEFIEDHFRFFRISFFLMKGASRALDDLKNERITPEEFTVCMEKAGFTNPPWLLPFLKKSLLKRRRSSASGRSSTTASGDASSFAGAAKDNRVTLISDKYFLLFPERSTPEVKDALIPVVLQPSKYLFLMYIYRRP